MMPGGSRGTALESGGFFVFLVLVTLALVWIAWPFASPILWAVLAAIMFQPLYQWFYRHMGGANRATIMTLLVITVAVIIPAFLIGGVVVDQAASVVLAFSEGRINIGALFESVLAALPGFVREGLVESGLGSPELIEQRAQDLALESSGMIAQQAMAITGSAFGFVLSFGIGIYVSYFLLRDGKQIGTRVLEHLPIRGDIAARLAERFLAIVRATIKGSVVVGLVQGALGAATYWIAGMPSIVLLGVLTAIFSLLPAVGPAIVWGPVAIYLLVTGDIWQGIVVLISGMAVIGSADNLLRPILVGRDTGIPDWLILITTLGGIAAMGLAGIVVGPLAAGLFLAGWGILLETRQSEAALT